MEKKIALTGGGTAGHVIPNLALSEELSANGWDIVYIGSPDGVEQKLLAATNIPYHSVRSGKLRRYFSWKNFIVPIQIAQGVIQSFFLLRQLKPDVVFSKGGFVAFPVVVGAWLSGIPVIAHESDITPGLANRLSFPFVNKICLNFSDAKKQFKNSQKVVVTGTPIRNALFKGDRDKGLSICDFKNDKPCILVVGGSQGSRVINDFIRKALAMLCKQFQVIHLCGKGKFDPSFSHMDGYCQLEYANEEMAHLFAAVDLVISRSGANSLCELLALTKPHILIPLSKAVSRGDQIQNAHFFQHQGISSVIEEESLTLECLLQTIDEVMKNREERVKKMKALNVQSASINILNILEDAFKG